jgi:hypothetical protein
MFELIRDYGGAISLDSTFDLQINEICKWYRNLDRDDSPIALIRVWKCAKSKIGF